MVESLIDGVLLTPLRVISVPEGDVFHAMKAIDPGYCGFGEAYFSTAHAGMIKSWKRHNRMTLNLVVIQGLIRFVIHDDRPASLSAAATQEFRLGPPEHYCRLTVRPGLWMAFQGLAKTTSLLLNVGDLPHDPAEVDRRPLDAIPYRWSDQ